VSAITLASLTFACAFGGALLGTYIRSFLPPAHLSKESLDVMRLGMGLVATMTALLLGLVTASARSTYDSQDAALRTSATNILTLDRLLARYGPETKPTRELIRQAVAFRIQTTWPDDGSRGTGLSQTVPAPALEDIERQILQLTPSDDAQRWFKSESLKLSEEVMKARWRILGAQGGTVPIVFLIVVIAWLTVTFGSFGLYTQPNASVVAILFLAALSVAAAIFLVLELDGPFDGFIKLSSGPMRFVLANLGQ
jgi:Protein of unknown function (DUF4239)